MNIEIRTSAITGSEAVYNTKEKKSYETVSIGQTGRNKYEIRILREDEITADGKLKSKKENVSRDTSVF